MDILDPLKQNAYSSLNSQHQYQDQQQQHQLQEDEQQLLLQQQHREQEQQYRELMNIANFQEKPLQSTEASDDSLKNHSNLSEYLQDNASQSVDSSGSSLQQQQQQQQCDLHSLSAFNNEDDTNLNSTIQDDANDDDSFVALCTDASSVLNNDPSRRYYINKLYQPMNGQSEEAQLIEHDDEYLLYQELRFLESTAQELTGSRRRGQLTKILEDDEGEDDDEDDDINDDQQLGKDGARHERLDQLRLTTMIEGFESFPSSPLIDSCHGRDPLISEACNSRNEQLQDKPDSTRHGGISPSSSNSSGCEPTGSATTSNYITSIDNFQHHHNHQPFDSDQEDHLQLTLGGNKDDGQHSHFLSLNSNTTMNHESQHNNNHHTNHHQQHNIHLGDDQYGQQMNQDSSSEISCFQQVTSTFESIEESTNKLCADQLASSVFSNHQSGSQSSKLQSTNLECDASRREKSSRKRSRHQLDEQLPDDTAQTTGGDRRVVNKSRVKRKRASKVNEMTSNKVAPNDSPMSSITSNMMSESEQSKSNQMSSTYSCKTDNEYQHEHITTLDEDHFLNDDGDLSMEDDDEDDTSSGKRIGRHPHMSKYRRRTANARERIRMREINQAFEKLKRVVPVELIQQSVSGDESDQTSVSSRRGKSATQQGSNNNSAQPIKLTKITTLRLAVSYIAKLSEVLGQHPEGNSVIRLSDSTSTSSENTGASGEADEVTQTPTTGVAKSKSGTGAKRAAAARKKRARSSGRKLTDDTRIRLPVKNVTTSEVAMKRNSIQDPHDGSAHARLESNVLVSNQLDNQQQLLTQPVIIANNAVLQQMPNNLVRLQPQQQQQQQQQQQKQQQFAFSQQPLTISQASNSHGQDRTFVTPVAVAILGIPTGNSQVSNEPQTLQLLGIQNAQQLQQRPQQFQMASSYNLVTHQPQQVTLTLDELNGLSVLRLANPQNGSNQQQQQQQQTLQLQHGQRIVQQSQLLTTAQGSYNYTAYQPLQTQQSNISNVRPVFQQAAIQFRSAGKLQNATIETKTCGNLGNNQQRTQSISNLPENLNDSATRISLTSTPTTTGTTSDYRSIGFPPSTIVQHISSANNSNNENNNVAQSTQFKLQQSNCTGHFLTNNLVALPAGTQLSGNHSEIISGAGSAQLRQTTQQANLIYINPPTTNGCAKNGAIININKDSPQTTSPRSSNSSQQNISSERFEICSNHNTMNGLTNEISSAAHEKQQNSSGNSTFDQTKFTSQFTSQVNQNQQEKALDSSEANIRQLVASIATSIHPSADKLGKASPKDSVDARRQPKRYRFHNYDGNMITNHLYSNGQDKQNQQQQPLQPSQKQQQKQQQQQQQPAKRPESRSDQSINQVSCQRSRQNSLSSTCSTTSTSSSSLASMSTASPNLAMVPLMIKSPSLGKSMRSEVETERSV